MVEPSIFPVTVYGSNISYFTGKIENYLRLKGIPYRLEAMDVQRSLHRVRRHTGSRQMPALELADGRWLSDTTVIIQWLEELVPEPAVMPSDPLQRFFSLLVEDHADEWLWRPAMHYRWDYEEGARFAADHLARELAPGVRVPLFLKRRRITRRQRDGYTTGDGITEDQVAGVEAIYLRTLSQLEAIFERRPFLLGARPTLADVAFSGPFFRHFGLDPVPAEILRQRAPAVFAWIGRLWNTRLEEETGALLDGIPDDWGPILDEIGSGHLPYLCANVEAVAAGRKRFDAEVGGVRYRGARSSRYRVWCLYRLRQHFEALPETERASARAILERHGCQEPLWRQARLPMEPGLCERLPFRADAKMIDVYD